MAVTFIPTIKEAVTYVKRFTWRDNAGGIVDTAGYSADMMIKDVVDGTLILELTDGNGRIVLGIQGSAPDDYNVEIVLSAADLTGLDWPAGPTRAVYDLLLTNGAYRKDFLEGWIDWKPVVTE
jgi:hypothetical protein